MQFSYLTEEYCNCKGSLIFRNPNSLQIDYLVRCSDCNKTYLIFNPNYDNHNRRERTRTRIARSAPFPKVGGR